MKHDVRLYPSFYNVILNSSFLPVNVKMMMTTMMMMMGALYCILFMPFFYIFLPGSSHPLDNSSSTQVIQLVSKVYTSQSTSYEVEL